MKSKNIAFFMIITALMITSTLNLNINNAPSQTDNIIDDEKELDNVKEVYDNFGLKPSDVSNNNRFDIAEQAGQWLWTKWTANKFNKSGEIILGQTGVAGVGNFFIELRKATGNVIYGGYATQIGDWLRTQHASLGYEDGKWPNKLATSGVSNFTGYSLGSAGIGSFFLNLFDLTGNSIYEYEAQKVHNYLDSIDQPTASGNGLAWREKDPVIITNTLTTPTSSSINNGTESPTTDLKNLNVYDGNFYEIDSDIYFDSDVEYKISLANGTGIDPLDIEDIDKFMSGFTVNISAKSNVTLDDSQISIRNHVSGTWVPIDAGVDIDTGEDYFDMEITANIKDYCYPWILIKVNTTDTEDHRISINALNVTILQFNNEVNRSVVATGAAGIGNFYLDFLDLDPGNQTLLDKATGAANFTIEQGSEYSNTIAWLEKGIYKTGISEGAAGIGKLYLRLYQKTLDIYYLNYAKKVADWLIINNATVSGLNLYNISLLWGNTNSSTTPLNTITSGMDSCAGIGQFLLDLGQEIGGNNVYITNATFVANWLTNLQYVITREKQFNYDVFYKWPYLGVPDYTYARGTAGALIFLNNMFSQRQDLPIFSMSLSRGVEWLIKTLNIQTDSWGDNSTYYNFDDGLTGIGYALLNIDLKRPEISALNVPFEVEFDDDADDFIVTFTINNYSSNIKQAFIRYNTTPGSYWQVFLTHEGGNTYSFQFPQQDFDTTFTYGVFIIDNNDTLGYDNNGSRYIFKILDSDAPEASLVPLYGKGFDIVDSGYLQIRVAQNHPRGADFIGVEVRIPILTAVVDVVLAIQFEWDSDENEYYYNYQIETEKGDNLNYDDVIKVYVDVYDIAGNVNPLVENINIIDGFDPTLDVDKDIKLPKSRWIPQFTSIKIEARVIDEESGLDPDEGVFVLYSINKGKTWNTVYFKKSGTKFVGAIPGQLLLLKVYFVIGAEDKEGNYVLWDKFGTTYSNIEDINVDSAWEYIVVLNWAVLLSIVGIIAAIIVVGYLLYSKRGGYLDKMRRKSRATATGLAIKERITNFYYNLVDKMNALGEKITKATEGGFGKVGLWFSEHMSERTKNVFRKIGRFLIAIPRGIINGIGNFFKGIGRLISRSKGWQIILYMFFGLLILITTTVQFIMEGSYPIRAVLFANIGFLLFISGIFVLLMRFTYKLAYK